MGQAGDSLTHLLLVTCLSPGLRGVLGGWHSSPSPSGDSYPWLEVLQADLAAPGAEQVLLLDLFPLIPQEQPLSHIPALLFLTETTSGVNCSHQSQRPATNSGTLSQLTTR